MNERNSNPDLGNYFCSSTGRDVFALLEEALTVAAETQLETQTRDRPRLCRDQQINNKNINIQQRPR